MLLLKEVCCWRRCCVVVAAAEAAAAVAVVYGGRARGTRTRKCTHTLTRTHVHTQMRTHASARTHARARIHTHTHTHTRARKGDCNRLLFDREWHRLVLDEGHVCRNYNSSFARGCQKLRAQRRWILTGTPLQNKIEEISCYFQILDVRCAAPRCARAIFAKWCGCPRCDVCCVRVLCCSALRLRCATTARARECARACFESVLRARRLHLCTPVAVCLVRRLVRSVLNHQKGQVPAQRPRRERRQQPWRGAQEDQPAPQEEHGGDQDGVCVCRRAGVQARPACNTRKPFCKTHNTRPCPTAPLARARPTPNALNNNTSRKCTQAGC